MVRILLGQPAHSLPRVVQIGFAGARRLFDPPPADPARLDALHRKVEQHLDARAAELRKALGLGPHHFLVGISQTACGGDTLFPQVCRARNVPQRIFLPQHRGAYLSATGSAGTPDERKESESLLAADPIIQERVVRASPEPAGLVDDGERGRLALPDHSAESATPGDDQ
jgi:hypothetical protein